LWPGSNGAITRHILRIVSAEKQRAKESGVVGLETPGKKSGLKRLPLSLTTLVESEANDQYILIFLNLYT